MIEIRKKDVHNILQRVRIALRIFPLQNPRDPNFPQVLQGVNPATGVAVGAMQSTDLFGAIGRGLVSLSVGNFLVDTCLTACGVIGGADETTNLGLDDFWSCGDSRSGIALGYEGSRAAIPCCGALS